MTNSKFCSKVYDDNLFVSNKPCHQVIKLFKVDSFHSQVKVGIIQVWSLLQSKRRFFKETNVSMCVVLHSVTLHLPLRNATYVRNFFHFFLRFQTFHFIQNFSLIVLDKMDNVKLLFNDLNYWFTFCRT